MKKMLLIALALASGSLFGMQQDESARKELEELNKQIEALSSRIQEEELDDSLAPFGPGAPFGEAALKVTNGTSQESAAALNKALRLVKKHGDEVTKYPSCYFRGMCAASYLQFLLEKKQPHPNITLDDTNVDQNKQNIEALLIAIKQVQQ